MTFRPPIFSTGGAGLFDQRGDVDAVSVGEGLAC